MEPIEEKQRITLNIDNHAFSMRVEKTEEEIFRKAEKVINSMIMSYQKAIGKGTDYTYLAYSTIQFVTDYLKEQRKTDDSDLLAELDGMCKKIDEFINK